MKSDVLKLIDWIITVSKFYQYNKPKKIEIRGESEKVMLLSNQYLSKFGTYEDEINRFIAFINNFDKSQVTNAIFLDIKL